MQKIGLNGDELQQLVKDLKAGKTWDQVVEDRLQVLAPGVLESTDYKEWALREAGLTPAAEPAPQPEAEEPTDEAPDDEKPRGKRGKR